MQSHCTDAPAEPRAGLPSEQPANLAVNCTVEKVEIMMKKSNVTAPALRPAAAAAVVSLVMLGCGGNGTTMTPGTGTGTTSTATPVVTSLTPTTAPAGAPTTFTVVGTNIPLKSMVSLPGGACASPTDMTASGFKVVCTPGATLGSVTAIVNNNALADGGWWIGQQTLNISAAAIPLGLLTDTGITASQCYGAGSDALISCTSAAALALNDKQDGMVGRDVANADGTDGLLGASYSFSGTDCVKDNVTGLVWQRASTPLKSLPGNTQNLEAADYRTAVNAASVCGFSDWRLPSPAELQSLLNYGASNAQFAIDMNWFAQTRSAWYLTGTPYLSGNSSNVWSVDFVKGRVDGIGASGGSLELRLVR